MATPAPNVLPKSSRYCVGFARVVLESFTGPGCMNPLSGASSHSKPSVPAGKVATWPGWRFATEVFRHSRIWAKVAGTVIESFTTPLTMNNVPVTAFSGLPPLDGGEKRGSRHVPVH